MPVGNIQPEMTREQLSTLLRQLRYRTDPFSTVMRPSIALPRTPQAPFVGPRLEDARPPLPQGPQDDWSEFWKNWNPDSVKSPEVDPLGFSMSEPTGGSVEVFPRTIAAPPGVHPPEASPNWVPPEASAGITSEVPTPPILPGAEAPADITTEAPTPPILPGAKPRPVDPGSASDARRMSEAKVKAKIDLAAALKKEALDRDRLSAFASIAEGLGKAYPSTIADYRIRGKAPDRPFVAYGTREKIARLDDMEAGRRMSAALRASGINVPDGLPASQLERLVGPLAQLEAYRRRDLTAQQKAYVDSLEDAAKSKKVQSSKDEAMLFTQRREFESQTKQWRDAITASYTAEDMLKAGRGMAAKGAINTIIRATGDKRISNADRAAWSGRVGIGQTIKDTLTRWAEGQFSPQWTDEMVEVTRLLRKQQEKSIWKVAKRRAEGISKITHGRISIRDALDALQIKEPNQTRVAYVVSGDGEVTRRDFVYKGVVNGNRVTNGLAMLKANAKKLGLQVIRTPGGAYFVAPAGTPIPTFLSGKKSTESSLSPQPGPMPSAELD